MDSRFLRDLETDSLVSKSLTAEKLQTAVGLTFKELFWRSLLSARDVSHTLQAPSAIWCCFPCRISSADLCIMCQ